MTDPAMSGEVAAQRQQLAQLVLREDRVGLALGLLEAPAELRLGEGGGPRDGAPSTSRAARGEERAEQQVAGGGARVLVAARSLAQAQREAPARDQRRRRVHAVAGRADGRHASPRPGPRPARSPRRRRPRPAAGRRRSSCRRGGSGPAGRAPRPPRRGRGPCPRGVSCGESRDRDAGLDEGRAVERPPGAAHARHQQVAEPAQEVAHVVRRRPPRHDGSDGVREPDRHVLAVVAVAQLGVEAVEAGPGCGRGGARRGRRRRRGPRR